MNDKLTEIADSIDDLLEEYIKPVEEMKIKAKDTRENLFCVSAVKVLGKATFIRIYQEE